MKIGWRIKFCVAVQRWPDASFLILYSSLLLFNAIAREIFYMRAKFLPFQKLCVSLQFEESNTMTQQNAIQLFEGKQVRIAWNEEEEKYYFSIVDVVQILTEQPTTRKASTYWAVVKNRLKEEGADELLTNCKQLKLPAADGKNYKTDVADLQQMLRIIQSIPSKKAEPIKQWPTLDRS